MVSFRDVVLAISALSAVTTIVIVASPMGMLSQQKDVSANYRTVQSNRDRIPCPEAQNDWHGPPDHTEMTDQVHLGEDENEDYTRHAITTPDEGSGAKVTTLPNGEIEGPSGPRRAAEPPSGMNSFMTESTNVRVIARETRLPRLSKRFLPQHLTCYGELPRGHLAFPRGYTAADYGNNIHQYCQSSPGPSCSCVPSGNSRRHAVVCDTTGHNARWQMALATTMCRTDACHCTAFAKPPFAKPRIVSKLGTIGEEDSRDVGSGADTVES
ncbi:hypothetical protein MMC16_002177 [Acarospora aff. strigata]|nr:hypothetical protein [Acarospora aff. strigata]